MDGRGALSQNSAESNVVADAIKLRNGLRAKLMLSRRLAADARVYQALTLSGSPARVSLAAALLRNRGLWLLTFHRLAHYCLTHPRRRSPLLWLARLCNRFGLLFNVVVCRSELSSDCQIQDGVYLSNKGYLMCGARSIGSGSLIHDRCTFGSSVAAGDEARPHIGKQVWIGPNCIIAGALTVGDGATVLPDSFLTFDVPPRAVVQGNPARIVRENFDNSALRRSLAIVHSVPTTDERRLFR